MLEWKKQSSHRYKVNNYTLGHTVCVFVYVFLTVTLTIYLFHCKHVVNLTICKLCLPLLIVLLPAAVLLCFIWWTVRAQPVRPFVKAAPLSFGWSPQPEKGNWRSVACRCRELAFSQETIVQTQCSSLAFLVSLRWKVFATFELQLIGPGRT